MLVLKHDNPRGRGYIARAWFQARVALGFSMVDRNVVPRILCAVEEKEGKWVVVMNEGTR